MVEALSAQRQQELQSQSQSQESISTLAFPQQPVTNTTYHHTRLLLRFLYSPSLIHGSPLTCMHYGSHLGLLGDESRAKFCMLETNKRMIRSIRELDKVNAYTLPSMCCRCGVSDCPVLTHSVSFPVERWPRWV